MIGLLALTMAGFIFFVRAETAGIAANNDGQQARLAAMSGFEELVATLRLARDDAKVWYDNPQRWRNVLVGSDLYTRETDPVRETRTRVQLFERGEPVVPTWRWSAVAEQFDGPDGTLRFGLTPEAGKLNLNSASQMQLVTLVQPLLLDMGLQNPQEIVDAILDWRDGDSDQRGLGAENEYYNTLEPAYNAKNGPFDTVEELLLVKGVTAAILYGEDVNRNGILDVNEDDGEASEPLYDNADGLLNRGIAPFLTVSARDIDTALDNKPRINLRTAPGIIAAQVTQQFQNNELSAATIAFLSSLAEQGIDPRMLRSPADLFPPGEEEIAAAAAADSQQIVDPGASSEESGAQQSGGVQPQQSDESEGKDGARSQVRRNGTGGKGGQATPGRGGRGGRGNRPPGGRQPAGENGGKPPADETGGDKPPRDGNTGDGRQPADEGNGDKPPTDAETGGGRRAGGDGSEDGQQPAGQQGGPRRGGRGSSRQSVMQALRNSPVTLEEMPYIMDRFSTRPPQAAAQPITGLININVAPARVLQLVPDITAEAVGAIVAMRQSLPAETLRTTAWPLTTGAVSPAVFKQIAPYITTKAYQFHVEILGYADHVKTARRYEWIIEMIGPMAQVKYFRDLTELGFAWPVDSETVVVSGE